MVITPHGIKIVVLAEGVPVEYDHTPDWSNEPRTSFEYNGHRYFFDEFMLFAPLSDEAQAGWDAAYGQWVWSELLIRFHDEEDTVTIARAFW